MTGRNWHLVADLGGTSARFGLADPVTGTLALRWETRVDQHASFAQALAAWLSVVAEAGDWVPNPDAACFAIASPRPDEPCVRMLNAPWVLDKSACATDLGLDQVFVLNDFEALGYAIRSVPSSELRTIVEATYIPGAPSLVIGPGTGLGTCSVQGESDSPLVTPGEGGHVDLPVANEAEWALHGALAQRHGHVSAERILSGAGLVALYEFFEPGTAAAAVTPEAIVAAAKSGADDAAHQAVMQFCAFLGAVCGNAVLTLGARGGVFLVGNILRDLEPLLQASPFAARFHGKGRYQQYLEAVPVQLVASEGLALAGALRFLGVAR